MRNLNTITLINLLLLFVNTCAFSSKPKQNPEQSLLRRAFLVSSVVAGAQFVYSQMNAPPGFRRIPTQFIAALGDKDANNGENAFEWGIWTKDPGPRGVWLDQYQREFIESGGVALAGWKFDSNDWWLEEHGLIMESPAFPLQPGRYLVTGGRLVTTILNVDETGKWHLEDKKAKLYDVTHLPCRSARYKPVDGGSP